VWPDFSEIPSPDRPFLRYQPLLVGETIEIDGRRFTALPANHTVPAVGYQLDSGNASLVYTGDTTACDDLWDAVNRVRNLRYLIIETAFSDRERQLAVMSKHLCPSMLAEELAKLQHSPDIYVTHLKPGQIELTMAELEENIGDFKPRMLQNNLVFEL
jgi:ribonuclease BN (tRNA processing enzyme)